MKRMTTAAAAAFLMLGGSAQAQMIPAFSTSGLYGELGYTFLKVDGLGTSGRPGAIRGLLGYEFHPMLAVEGFFGGGVQDDDRNIVVNGISNNVSFDAKSMYGIWLRPKYAMNQFELFARLGWAHTKVNVEARPSGLNATQSDDDFSWGIGANYRFNRNFYGGIDWIRYSNQSDHKVDGLTLSVGYHW